MLIFKRKPGQAIVVPKCELTIKVISIASNSVLLSFSAPDETDVHREEVWLRIREEPDQSNDQSQPKRKDYKQPPKPVTKSVKRRKREK
jgi:carbon storage regulator